MLAEAIRKNRFNRRYGMVGRALLAQLADIFDIDMETARRWADEADARDEQDARRVAAGTAEGGGNTSPSSLSADTRITMTPERGA